MYTFSPIPSVPVDHVGFGIIAFGFSIAWLFMLYNAREENISVWKATLLMAIIPAFAYMVSYEWTEQEPKVFANTKVEGTFVRFVAEGYNEARTSGKQTRRVDVHNMYVEYSVNGQSIVLPASTGVTYPPVAILYKN